MEKGGRSLGSRAVAKLRMKKKKCTVVRVKKNVIGRPTDEGDIRRRGSERRLDGEEDRKVYEK